VDARHVSCGALDHREDLGLVQISHRRAIYALSLVAVSGIGIVSRVFHTGFLLMDKYLGDVVYAVVFYLFLGVVWERAAPHTKAALTLIFVLAVELFQLTLIPLRLSLSDSFLPRLASILLGTQFAWWDIAAYLVGIGGVFLVDRFYVGGLGKSWREGDDDRRDL
jgi:hypothetical protein